MREATRIAYLVHDLNDPAVARRVRMLRAGGAEVVVAGFRRDGRVPETVVGAPAVDLGRTADARLGQRAGMVAAALLRPAALAAAATGADVVVARNLESLVLAARARRMAKPGARLVYECLDIHRSLLGSSPASRAVQWVEGRLLRGVDLLIVSSPAFLREYFSRRASLSARGLLVENKLLAPDGPPAVPAPPPGPPWTIGWFGMLRCRRTFAVLSDLARAMDGRVRVLIAGRPSPAEFADFPAAVAAAPHCDYAGPFAPDALPGLYARCHFAWAVDWFEEGLNSTWLLPNRLYEAGAFGAAPIALGSVETGRWLAAHGAGVLLGDGDPAPRLRELFGALDGPGYARLRGGVAAIPRGALVATADDCAALLGAVTGR